MTSSKKLILFFVLLFAAIALARGIERAYVERCYDLRAYVNRGYVAQVYYVTNFGSLAATMANTFPIGSIIDGSDQVYNERLSVLQNGITVRKMVIDGTVSADGSYSYHSGNVYTNVYAWANVSGEIWVKTNYATTCQLYEDGILLTPIVCVSHAEALANLTRGTFTSVVSTNRLYYRASDGGNPNTHLLRIPNSGITYLASVLEKTNVTLQDIHLRNFDKDGYPLALYIRNSANLVASNLTVTNCGLGIEINTLSNFQFLSCNIVSNVEDGIKGEGVVNGGLFHSNQWAFNGTVKAYDGLYWRYTNDCDGFAFGQTGLFCTNLTLSCCIASSNGPPSTVNTAQGNGIVFDTTNPSATVGLVITNCKIYGNHNRGISTSTQVVSRVISNNILAWNGQAPYGGAALLVTLTQGGSAIVASNLFVANEGASDAETVSWGVPWTNCTAQIYGNVFFNNSTNNISGNYFGDIRYRWSYLGKTNIVDKWNTFIRNPPFYLNRAVVLDDPDTKYTILEITNAASPGFYVDSVTNGLSLGLEDVCSTNSALVSPVVGLTFP